MDFNFVIIRRTKAEIKAFGGDIYADIDGKNVAIIKDDDVKLLLSLGKHSVKMYKSHKMGTFIGTTEVEFEILENEVLCSRYSAPLIINQAGNIMLFNYESDEQINQITNEIENIVNRDFETEQKKIAEQKEISEKNNTNFFIWLFLVPVVIGLIYWVVAMGSIY